MPRRGAISGPAGPPHHKIRPDIVKRPPPRFGGREVIIVPSQRLRATVHQPATQPLVPTSSQEHATLQSYDGTEESFPVSRLTSMTWSTVSHRILSDSSGSSRKMGASFYRDEYNKLAEKHRLPQLKAAPGGMSRRPFIMASNLVAEIRDDLDDEKHSQTKTTTKSHHQGWLARKLFRRSSSTYTLKAKTTYKPISKKKSFGGIPILSEVVHNNTLKGKSLEELSRLGGLSVFELPPDFAVDKLILPTCLSAAATYLYQHGESFGFPASTKSLPNNSAGNNAPGIFRVSGQTTIVNALYEFYDHQFSNADAGSPSKVEQTIGSGLLPSHIEHTVPDVASFFKRVLIDLPGGLLGSVELFEALRNVTMNFEHDPELPEPDLANLKAKLIALAISSVASDYRSYLIQAVLGLVSYIGHEAEKLQAETASTDEDQASSELMSYRSLGVVMGPLLLGNLTDSAVHGSREGLGGAPRTSLELDSAKKFRKHKRKHSDLKLDQSATLAAFVDRANRTAIVMQQLISMWPDVVKQLRNIDSTASSSLDSRSKRRLKKLPSHAGSRLTMKTSEEDMRFLDILRGRTLPEEFRGAVNMKSNIRITSRSPMSRGAIAPSEDDDTWIPAGSEENGNSNAGHSRVGERAAQDNDFAVDAKLRFVKGTNRSHADDIGLSAEDRTDSDIAMEKMAMGTILPPLQMKPSSSPRREFLRLVDPSVETPPEKQNSSSSSRTPETAFKDAPPVEHSHGSDESSLQISMGKPLPPIGDVQKAELAFPPAKEDVLDPPSRPFGMTERPRQPRHNTSSKKSSRNSFSSHKARQSAERTIFPSQPLGQSPSSPTKQIDEMATFPPRQSSLPMDKHLALKPIEAYNSLAEYKAKADTYIAPPKFSVSRKVSKEDLEQRGAHSVVSRPNSVKILAERFAEAPKAMHSSNEQAKETAIPKVYAFVNSLPSPKSSMPGLDDPFFSAESNNVSRESLIPKPVRDVGRNRQSRSLSPPKRAAPKIPAAKRHSAFGVETNQDTETVQKNIISSPPATPTTPGEGETYDEMIVNSNGIGFSEQPLTQTLDAYHHQHSAESLHCLKPLLQQSPPGIRHLHSRTISFAELAHPISPSRSDSPSLSLYANPNDSPTRSNNYLDASNALKPLERHNSLNATMYAQICRLQRLLQQMGEEKEAKDRRIEVLEEVQGVNPVAAGVKAKGSFGKGGMHNEVRKVKRELSIWKMRAEVAEKRLAGLQQSSDMSRKSGVMYPGHAETTERPDVLVNQGAEQMVGGVRGMRRLSSDSWKRRAIAAESQLAHINKPESAGKEIDVQEVREDSPDSWKRRAIIAESQLAQFTALTETRQHSEPRRTTPSPLTAKVYVAVETENGEKRQVSWDLRGGGSPSHIFGGYGRSNSERETGRQTGPVEKSGGSDGGSSDFASPLNGFG